MYINGKSLKQAHQKVFQSAVAGSFRLGAHWPPRAASLTAIALDDALEEGEIEPSTALRDALVQVLRRDEEEAALAAVIDADAAAGAVAGDAAAPAARKKRPAARKTASAAKRSKSSAPASGAAADSDMDSADDVPSSDDEAADEAEDD